MSYYSVGLSQNSQDLRFGFSDQKTILYNKLRDRTIIKGTNKFILLANSYIESYQSKEINKITLLDQKDYYLSFALLKLIRCCQTVDSNFEVLTNHSKLYWSEPLSYYNVWGEVPVSYVETNAFNLSDNYYGVAGSLAFYIYKYNINLNNTSPLNIIRNILNSVWAELNVPSYYSPLLQHQTILERTGLLNIDFIKYEKAFNYLLSSSVSSLDTALQNIVFNLRRDSIDISDFSNLKQQFIFLTVSPTIINSLEALQTYVNNNTNLPTELNLNRTEPNSFKNIKNNILNLAKPAGFSLIYLLFVVQALLNISTNIISFDNLILNTSYYELIKSSKYQEQLLLLVDDLSTAYDAYAALAYLNTQTEARACSYFFYKKAVELLSFDPKYTHPYTSNSYRLNQFL